MAIKTYEAGTITDDAGNVTPLIVHEPETPADLAILLGMDMDELADLQDLAEMENWG